MFKKSFKYYKSRCPQPDLSDVIDFKTVSPDKATSIIFMSNDGKHMCGLRPITEWRVKLLKSHPGFFHISNAFTAEGLRYWIGRSLSAYTKRPNCRLNLDALGDLCEGEEWWEICTQDASRAKTLQPRLRWATLGYHHNWDSKEYSESQRDPFPEDLAALSRYVTDVLGYSSFEAQAAIVNFYHADSTLAGHTDHSEQNSTAPLLSVSFGCSAIFLLGGRTIDTDPTAMFLRSGDIVLMAEESRLCYHGVPRILPNSETAESIEMKTVLCTMCTTTLDNFVYMNCGDEEFWQPFGKYVETSRINLNVRQVLYPGQNNLDNIVNEENSGLSC